MIGSLINYKCGGSNALAIILDAFVLRIPEYESPMARDGDTLISVEWITPKGGRNLRPSSLYLRDNLGEQASRRKAADKMRGKAWYNLRNFKVENAT